MFDLRPHTFKCWVKISDGYYDENHDWHEGVYDWGAPVRCRYESNGHANTIALPDGSAYTYSYVVYLDIVDEIVLSADSEDLVVTECELESFNLSVYTDRFSYGDKVQLSDQIGNIVDEKQIKGFHQGQLNARIWL